MCIFVILSIDFLPMKCDACSKIFCDNHFTYEKHHCPESYKKVNYKTSILYNFIILYILLYIYIYISYISFYYIILLCICYFYVSVSLHVILFSTFEVRLMIQILKFKEANCIEDTLFSAWGNFMHYGDLAHVTF